MFPLHLATFFLLYTLHSHALLTDTNDVDLKNVSIEVDVSCRNLTFLPAAFDPSTKALNASLNNITTIRDELKALSRLETLILRFNRLTTLEFLPEPCHLKKLDASRNAITTLRGPLASCVVLESLNLTANNISNIPEGVFMGMRNLRVLYMAGNKLAALAPDVFAGTRSLERLRLNGNRLKELPDSVFKGLHALKYLDLSLNNLTSFPIFQDCCDGLQGAYIRNNSISWASESTLRSFLQGNASTARDASGNPLRPSALAWAARDPQLRLLVHDNDCACGLVHHPPTRASLKLCAAVACSVPGAHYADWVTAVRTAALQDADPALVDALALAVAPTVSSVPAAVLMDPTVPSVSTVPADFAATVAPTIAATNVSFIVH